MAIAMRVTEETIGATEVIIEAIEGEDAKIPTAEE